jgi:hypothetical protein
MVFEFFKIELNNIVSFSQIRAVRLSLNGALIILKFQTYFSKRGQLDLRT